MSVEVFAQSITYTYINIVCRNILRKLRKFSVVIQIVIIRNFDTVFVMVCHNAVYMLQVVSACGKVPGFYQTAARLKIILCHIKAERHAYPRCNILRQVFIRLLVFVQPPAVRCRLPAFFLRADIAQLRRAGGNFRQI